MAITTHTEVSICNRALRLVGVGVTLASTDGTLANKTTDSDEADEAVIAYGAARDLMLAAAPWSFAMTYATLALADDGDGEIWDASWGNAYTIPSDCLRVWRFVKDNVGSSKWGPCGIGDEMPYASWAFGSEWKFEIKLHGSVPVILTDVDPTDAQIEYIASVSNVSTFSHPFIELLSAKIALDLAPVLSVSSDRVVYAQNRMASAWNTAVGHNENEQSPREWPRGKSILARGDD